MKSKLTLILTLFFGLLAFVINPVVTNIKTEGISFKNAQRVFNQKVKQASGLLAYLSEDDSDINSRGNEKLRTTGISILVYSGDTLKFWSDNTIPVSNIDVDTILDKSLVNILFNTYFCLKDTSGKYDVFAMIHLASNYPYENKFLQNGISPDFKLPGRVFVSAGKTKNSFAIRLNGQVAFYFGYTHLEKSNKLILNIISTIFFFLAILLLLYFSREYLKRKSHNNLRALGFIVIMLLARVLIGVLNISSSFLLFDPLLYATKIAPSFGDLILNTIVYVYACYIINRFIRLPEKYTKYAFNRKAWIGILNVIYILIFVYAFYSSSSLINHSSIKIVIHDISLLTFPALIAYLLLAFNYLGLMLVALWIVKNLKAVRLYSLLISLFVMFGILLLISITAKNSIDIYSLLFAFILYPISWYVFTRLRKENILSSLVVILLLFSVFILTFAVRLSRVRDFQKQQSQAISLSTEHDPVAEYLFSDLSEKLREDTLLKKGLYSEDFNLFELTDNILKNYFTGYWKKYDIKVTVCQSSDSVLVNGNEFYWYPCYLFFDEMVRNTGLSISNSDFYYLDRVPGLINYLGWIKYNNPDRGELSLFVEMDSKLTTKPLGYPELLLDEDLQPSDESQEYSYAKYYKGNLISHVGRYEYSLISESFENKTKSPFSQVIANGYVHLVYQTNKDNIIVISKPENKFLDYLVLFSYIFVFYYLIAILVIFLLLSDYRQIRMGNSLRSRIQVSIISILIISLVLIASSTIWFNVRKYNQTQYRILEEKINSVYVELEHKLSYYDELTPDWYADKYDNLGQLLVKFSDVFYTDINLYDPNGDLLATSREEIFQLGLQSKKMDPDAYAKMEVERRARFVHREQINNLYYLSAYVPFINTQGHLLAYLNLPYFTKQKELQEDITTLTVAIINIYVLLILLTIIIAVVISDQITKPLEMIQNRFKALKLGGKYEIIEYARNDEIGRLIREYNNMVLELEKKIDLLAKSERETAWREMAKQVAHEIKNPLTPMRLSVQQLKRSWDDKREDFDDYLNRVSITLIEQIDNLSAIAGAFSNFAKMPVPNMQEVNLKENLKAAVALFNANKKVIVELDVEVNDLYVIADPDQLNRIFINIIKNGIQAIPENKQGYININLIEQGKCAVVKISDNGKGIPESIKDKLFTPSFTTKTSGMGLGLAIVKNILEGLGGKISFTTQIDKGTTFEIELPLK